MAASQEENFEGEHYDEDSFESSLSEGDLENTSAQQPQNSDQQNDNQLDPRLSLQKNLSQQDSAQGGSNNQQIRGARVGSIVGKGDAYQQRNQEIIQKLTAKKKEQQAEKEKNERRQKKREEKLRARMLAEASKAREQKEAAIQSNQTDTTTGASEKNLASGQNSNCDSLASIAGKTRGSINTISGATIGNENEITLEGEQNAEGNIQRTQIIKQSGKKLKFKDLQQMYELVVVKGKYSKEQLTEEQKLDLEELESKINEEKEQLQKLQKVFKSRQITFLEEIKKKQEKKKQEEQEIKQKQEKKLSKMKEQYENVTSNLYAETELFKLKKIEKEDPKGQQQRSTSADEASLKEEKKEGMKRIQQKNQEYIEKLKEKIQVEKTKEEEEKKKKEILKEKMKEFVLVNIKKEIENGQFYVDVPEKRTKKDKKKDENNLNSISSPKTLVTPLTQTKKVEKLPKIKDANKENSVEDPEDDEDYEEGGDDGDESPNDEELEPGVIKRKLRKYPFIVDLDVWRKKQRLPADQKVFIVTGGYHDIKKSLRKRGWVDNPDSKSPCFNLRWSLQTKDIDYENLKDFQVANHFQKSACITTKVGLSKSIRNLIWHENVDIDTFYPRCYDLNDQEDFDNFVEEFKTSKAESILKRYMRMYVDKDEDLEKIKKQAVIALNVCERKMRDLDDIIDDPNDDIILKTCVHLVTKKEWNILSSDELSAEKLAQKKYDSWLERIEGKKKQADKKKKKKKKTEQAKEDENEKNKEGVEGAVGEEEEEEEAEEDEDEEQQMDEFTLKVNQILKKYKEKFSQDTLTGEDNIWIIKPAGLSRGRGITCYNNLVEILDHVKSKESQWVIQKYIENPLIIKKRKFDMRVWVLVTDWNPLTIWHFVDCYVRFSVDDYDTENLQNKFTHLTNNMISKLKQREEKDDISELGNMYFKENFIDYLKEKEGSDIFHDKIEPAMRHAIIMSLKSVQDTIENRKGNHEMYGYDFMIDDLYNTWLIEINSSPCMEYSTPVTERLVKAVSEDIVRVIVDYGMEKSKKARKEICTGAFKRIYKGKYVEEKTGVVGLNLVCEGVAFKKKKNNTAKVVNLKPTFSPAP